MMVPLAVRAAHLARLLCLCWVLSLHVCYAQTEEAEPPWEIKRITFKGNQFFDDGALHQAIQSRERPGFLTKLLGKFTGEDFGPETGIFHPENITVDEQRLTEGYLERGFYHSTIRSLFVEDTSHHQVTILFEIVENKRSFVDSVLYRGLDTLSSDLKAKLLEEPLIRTGMPYERAKAPDEIKRVLTMMADNGYRDARYNYDSSGAYEYLSTNNYMLVFTFLPGPLYRFGSQDVRVDPPRSDITNEIVLRELDFKPGDIFSREKKISSERNLNRLGTFEAARIEPDSSRDSLHTTTIPIEVLVRPRARNELAPELIISNQGDELNLGLGMGYTDRNFFGDARAFNANIRARTQSLPQVLGGKSFDSPEVVAALDLQLQIVQPYLFTRTLSGSILSNLSLDKQKAIVLYIVRNKAGLTKQFATYTLGSVDWTLERIQPVIDSSVQVTLREDERPQFNSILTFTLQRDKTNDPFSPTEGFFHSISIEESGVLPNLLHAAPLSYTEYYKLTLFGRWYYDLSSSRFNILALKLRTGYQDKYGASRERPVTIPLNRRFYSGGSGSLRGWRARELGAMPDPFLLFGGNFTLESSLEMRVNHFRGLGKWAFIRFDNIWGVYFLDMGNTWSNITDVRMKDIAIGAGIGFRYETFFGPFRIDYGIRVYDPKAEPGRQTIFKKQFLSETLGSGVFHFGIGHAF
ncbi:MAG: BamA/TamA family outer membrane protein [Ignavibacteria bacterium]|nr:BamA/TamA family outer membrane protein [Ignavibacteria bacterium]